MPTLKLERVTIGRAGRVARLFSRMPPLVPIGILCATCLACGGAIGAWNSRRVPTVIDASPLRGVVTVDEALRVLEACEDEGKREQALGVLIDRDDDLQRAIIAEERRGKRCARYATAHLEACKKAIEERRK